MQNKLSMIISKLLSFEIVELRLENIYKEKKIEEKVTKR